MRVLEVHVTISLTHEVVVIKPKKNKTSVVFGMLGTLVSPLPTMPWF